MSAELNLPETRALCKILQHAPLTRYYAAADIFCAAERVETWTGD